MYRIIPLRIAITLLMVLGAGLLALFMWLFELIFGQAVTWWQVPRIVSFVAGLVPFAILGVLALVWRPLWRWIPWLNRSVFPDLNGIWRGDMRSNWVDPDTQQRVAPKEVTLTISHGWRDFSVRLQTDQAQSFSNRVFLEKIRGTKIFRVWYGYVHKPEPEYRPNNPPHEGFGYLEYDVDQPRLIIGRYYTDRETTGSLSLKRRQ